jgi:transposase-like protein
MAPAKQDTAFAQIGQNEFHALIQAQMREAVRWALITVLEEEVTVLIGANPYERTASRRDHRNGYYTRDLETSVGHLENLPVPRTRRGHQTQVFERYQRRRAEVDQTISEMFVRGVSTQGVGVVLEQLNGTQPSASTVSRVFHSLDAEYAAWKKRPLAEHYAYCFADGTYFSVVYDDEGCKMPILAVIGVRTDGQREVLAFSVGDRENQDAWEQLLDDLKQRGVKMIDLWITDGNQAMLNALAVKFPTTPRQRCIKHKMENVLSYVPQSQRELIYPELRALFYQDSRIQADQAVAAFCAKYEKVYPTAVECLERDLEACLTFYAFSRKHWRTIRTTNVIERLFEEVKRRSHKMGAAFRNESSCLLMFYAIVRMLKFHKVVMST